MNDGWFGMDRFELDVGRTTSEPKVPAKSLSARGSFSLTHPSVPTFNPGTVKCESCGTPVFVLSMNIGGKPVGKRWMERPVPTGAIGEVHMDQHTRERRDKAREALG